MTVDRLDFSKPPPGYNLDIIDDEWWWGDEPEWLAGTSYLDRDAALAAAWAHHKARHDPPGMFLDWSYDEAGSSEGECSIEINIADGRLIVFFVVADDQNTGITEARAAAWAWYEDALEVADLLDDEDIRRVMERVGDGCPLRGDPWWPRVLAWSADQRAEVRHWLAGGAVVAGWMPEVLRG